MAKNVPTHHYDNARTGWNRHETKLTPAKVSGPKFTFLFQQTVDDIVYAQPLYFQHLHIKGAKRSLVFVGTE